MATCTVRYATTGLCGKPALIAFGAFAECAEHAAAPTVGRFGTAGTPKPKVKRFCRKAVCVEEAMGFEFVGHLAGTCGR